LPPFSLHRYIHRAAATALNTALNADALSEKVSEATDYSLVAEFSLSVLLAGRYKLQRLNHQFRNINRSTDVLAFPSSEPGDKISKISDNSASPTNSTNSSGVFLGDLALAHEELRKTARQFHTSPQTQLAHLVIHGMLHLLGHDHDTRKHTIQMRDLETQALAQLKLPSPWNNLQGKNLNESHHNFLSNLPT
ncbi:MAG: rRNA maturation RNase YbeY, partial [Alphaproteobacteria bacterium]